LSALAATALIVGLFLFVGVFMILEDRLGTPEYFEGVTGLRIQITEPVVYCRRESFPDISGVWVFHIDPESAKILLNPPASFRNYPRQRNSRPPKTLIAWRTGALRHEDQQWLDSVMTAVQFVEGGDCQGTYSAVKIAADIQASIGRPSTHYSYQYKHSGNIDFTIIDAQAGIIYYLVVDD
jgi:hypothetical protein